jgi:hypothetical protein
MIKPNETHEVSALRQANQRSEHPRLIDIRSESTSSTGERQEGRETQEGGPEGRCEVSIAQKVWETLYPDRRPWSQLAPDTQAEWEQMVQVVAMLNTSATKTVALDLQDCLEVALGKIANVRRHFGETYVWDSLVNEDIIEKCEVSLAKSKEVLP